VSLHIAKQQKQHNNTPPATIEIKGKVTFDASEKIGFFGLTASQSLEILH